MGEMIKKIKELILRGEFLEARATMDCITKEELEIAIFEIGCDEESICAYSFICFLLLEKESVEYHCLASKLLNIAFPHIYGGYQTSLYHIRKAIELEPHNKELKKELLFFNDLPEKLVSDEEAREIRNELCL